jgi:hypothetical protein
MNRYDTDNPALAWYALAGFALGVLTMYLFDPAQGNRRRALVKDKVYSATVTARKRADARARDIAHRARGLAAEARRAVGATSERSGAAGSEPSAGRRGNGIGSGQAG